jgi:PAS domain-containing protein
VVIVNCDGKIIEINESCEKIFGYPKSSLIGHDLSFLTGKIEDYGDTFKPSMNFFRALSHNILFRLSHGDELNYLDVASYFSGVGPNESIITLINPEKGEQKFSFSFSVLDNEPEELEDITYIGFFKQEPSLDRRASD